jgi:hypothetical protein
MSGFRLARPGYARRRTGLSPHDHRIVARQETVAVTRGGEEPVIRSRS